MVIGAARRETRGRLDGLLVKPLLVLELLPLVFGRNLGFVGGDLRSSVGIARGLLQTNLSLLLLLLLMGPTKRCNCVLRLMAWRWGQNGHESRPVLMLDTVAIPLVFAGTCEMLSPSVLAVTVIRKVSNTVKGEPLSVLAGVRIRTIPNLEDRMDRLEDLIGNVCGGCGQL